jgi:uncharacterized protein YcbX
VNDRGIKGDRLFAIRDRQGKFVSGIATRRFRKIDRLFEFRATYPQGIPEIQCPNGQRILRLEDDRSRPESTIWTTLRGVCPGAGPRDDCER